MRKLLVTLALAGTLCVPSVVFAEASWYGSLRGGLNIGGGSDAKFFDGGSRWGIKGSAEVSDGLTAVYRFEHKISTTDAGQPGGRLAYAGLTGSFGSLTLGQIWNAAYNHAGAITDKSYYFGDAGTGYRHGNALSYSFSSGALGFQLDLIADGGMDTGKAIDKTEFGMTIGLGEIGKVAIAHTTQRDQTVTSEEFMKGELPTVTPGTPPSLTPGTPASLTPGTPPSLTPGTPPSLTPGTPPSLNPGEYPTNRYMNIVASVSTDSGETFNLEIDSDGNLMVLAATRWIAGGNKYMTASVINKMHTTKVNPADGALDGDSTADTHVDRTATPVILEHTNTAGTLPNAAELASLYDKTETGYRLKACDTSGTTCNQQAAFVVEYRGGDTVIDQETGNLVAPVRLTFVGGDSAEISHEGEVQVADGITEGTPPTLDPGTEPTLDPGTEPTLNAGTGPTLDPGTEPTLDPGTSPTLTGGSVSEYVKVTETVRGHKSTHVAIEFGLGGITPYIGYSEKTVNGATNESKTTHYGFSGALGDTGMSFLVAGRNVKGADGGKSSPWLANVSRSLGGGATVIFEHGNSDDGTSGQSRVGLHVSF